MKSNLFTLKKCLRAKRRIAGMSILGALTAFMLGCINSHVKNLPASFRPAQALDLIDRSLPYPLADRAGWISDIYAGFASLDISPTHENICAVAAVIAQESGFQVDPVVPGMPAIAWREIDARAAHAAIPRLLVHSLLELKSSSGASYADRIDRARTERDLSRIYEDFIDAVPLGRTLLADRDPIRTRGPMQVHVAFAAQFTAQTPYPYPIKISLADEVFTRRGGVYFGIAHLLAYRAPYEDYRYRFADFNAGQWASRNAAFQHALGNASGIALVRDGALLQHDADPSRPSSTELAARALAPRLQLGESAIHDALELAKRAEFADTPLYRRVFAIAEPADARPLPRAEVPRIELHGPKITRALTTLWYANRVNARFERCLKR